MFSPVEEKILKIMRRKRCWSITEIAEKYFSDTKKSLNPNATISGAILRINKKCKYHKLDWFINGTGSGRGGKLVWMDK